MSRRDRIGVVDHWPMWLAFRDHRRTNAEDRMAYRAGAPTTARGRAIGHSLRPPL